MVEMSYPHLNRDHIPSAKEQIMSDKVSVSRAIKSLHAKNGNGLSLKEFARRLVRDGEALAETWLANKAGACNASRSESNKTKAAASGAATKSAKRKVKKSGGAAAPSK